jgi:iron complex outermembrane receptor protein
MKTFPSLTALFASLGVGFTCAQTVPPAAPAKTDAPFALDPIIVTGSADPRAAFDLAQGASVLSGDALRARQQSTLGETLAGLPGVASTYYGPGASRPIIRGLGGDRVRMLDNGVGSLDASNVSPDHNVAVEPLLTERIEVLRGPARLLYGSSAVGADKLAIRARLAATQSAAKDAATPAYLARLTGTLGLDPALLPK